MKITKNTVTVMDTTWGFRRLFRVFWRKLKRLEVQPPWPVTVIGKWKKRKLFLVLKLHRLYHFSGHSENGVVFSGLREEKMWLFLVGIIIQLCCYFFLLSFYILGVFWTVKWENVWTYVEWVRFEGAWDGRGGFIGACCDEEGRAREVRVSEICTIFFVRKRVLLKMWLGRSEPHECEPGPWLLKTQFRNFVIGILKGSEKIN